MLSKGERLEQNSGSVDTDGLKVSFLLLLERVVLKEGQGFTALSDLKTGISACPVDFITVT